MKWMNKRVASYQIDGQRVDVILCWSGDNPELDANRFYEFFNEAGKWLNEGEPWHDDGQGIPSASEIQSTLMENK